MARPNGNGPAGFLTDGPEAGAARGTSWLYHDYLYATHAFSSGGGCTRAEADQVNSSSSRCSSSA